MLLHRRQTRGSLTLSKGSKPAGKSANYSQQKQLHYRGQKCDEHQLSVKEI